MSTKTLIPATSLPFNRQAEPPIETEGLKIEAPAQYAAGIHAVTHALDISFKQMGLLRTFETLTQVNQKKGFDCPGCAWPDPDDHRSMNEYCENGAKAVAEEATTRRVEPKFFAKYSVSELSAKSDYWLSQQGRLTRPMYLPKGKDHYEPISWDKAFEIIAGELNALESPNQALFYTSGRTSNEAAFLYQLFVREYGTNNLPDCSNMCHESSGSALIPTIGIGKGTVTLDDFDHADAIFVIGQNPGTNHPRMMSSLENAAKRGATIVSVNPLPEPGLIRFKHPQHPLEVLGSGTTLSKLYLQVKINGDMAMLKGMMKAMLAAEDAAPGTVFDWEFIREKTEGVDAVLAALREVSWESILEQSGIEREQIEAAAQIAIRSKATIVCWAMGLTQHKNSVAEIKEVVNFLLLRGMFGKKGAGACPVRGHSNVQGDRTMGINEYPPPALLDAIEREFGFAAPREDGLTAVYAIEAMHEGKAKVFFAMGGNFLSATPDTKYTAEALSRCELTAHVSTKLNRSHLIAGKHALILPCLGRTELDVQESGEQFVTVENSMGVVHMSRGRLRPASEFLLSEPMVVAKLARATLGSRSKVNWEYLVADYDRIREKVERVIPGFTDYNVRVRKPGGFYLPNGPREGKFTNPQKKAQFTVHPMTNHRLGKGEFLMMTIRTHDQYNTTIYGLDDRYRGLFRVRRVVMMNEEDMRELGLSTRQHVDITSHFQGETREAKRFIVVPYNIPRGNVATYFPEANVLVPLHQTAEISHTPVSKSVLVTLKPSVN